MKRPNIGRTILRLVTGDIAEQATEAVVTAAHWRLNKGNGTDGTIHTKGGPRVYEECLRIGGCPIGDAVITTGGNLKARFVIHAVGPVWHGGDEDEPELLASAYRKSLELAVRHGLRSISFPSISTGAFVYPIRLAAPVALKAILDFLHEGHHQLQEVRMVLYTREDDTAYAVYKQALDLLLREAPVLRYDRVLCLTDGEGVAAKSVDAAGPAAMVASDEVSPPLPQLRILYVEDHAVFANSVITQFLFQHAVTLAPSLSAARQALMSGSFDLLLVDYDLNDGKGDELVKEVCDAGKALPAIGVSSHDEGNAALLRAGAVAVCSKMQFDRIQSVIVAVTSCGKADDGHLLWWLVPGTLAGMPMPFIHPQRRMNGGGPLAAYEDDLPVLYASGVRAVVSLLNIPTDAGVYESAGFAYKCLPVADGSAPTMEQAEECVAFTDSQLAAHRPVAVHCEAGLGRTGTMLAAYLIAQGDSAEAAIARVRAAERSAIETQRQVHFLEAFAAARRPRRQNPG